MKILHFSDPHTGGGAGDWRAYFDKRIVGVFNYRFRRRFKMDLNRLAAMVEYVQANPVDVVVCTGDLTSTGQPGEFAAVKEYLRPLRDSGTPFLYVPGNHDCYVKRPSCVRAMEEMVGWLSRGSYVFSDMPLMRTVGECDFILLNSSFPSNLLCSWGKVRGRDVELVEKWCSGEKKRPRILVGHFPLQEAHPILRFRHRLYGQKKLLELLRSGAIDLSLCGHVHRPTDRLDGRGRGESIAGSICANGVASLITYDQGKDVFGLERLEFKR
ncbi:MAG: metallophosphoesterase [Victivallaceae bacterium]|nr:metallophosphoesterase [Victivallaceae bacterium]